MAGTFGATSTTDEVLEGVDLRGKRVLVTGVSAGLGVETARALAAHGAQVVGAARDLDKARRATEAVIVLFAPKIVYSVGFAGALDTTLKVSDILIPRLVLDARDGSSLATVARDGAGVLVTLASVAKPLQKASLGQTYGAQAVDMEAAAVGRGAQARDVPFAAVKAISDEVDFAMPSMSRFVDPDGNFNATQFALFSFLRPWLWSTLLGLARNSSSAAQALCTRLEAIRSVGTESGPVASNS